MDSRAYWNPDDIDHMIPPLAETGSKNGQRRRPGSNTSTEPGKGTGEPPVPLSRHDKRAWDGEERCERDGSVDRSGTLYWIACGVARAIVPMYLTDAAKVNMIADAIEDRDRALGFDKFTDRPAMYQETAGRAFAEVAATHASLSSAPLPPGDGVEHDSAQADKEDGDGFDLPPELELTDLGNSHRFAHRTAGRFIYSPGAGGYAEYRAGRYVRDDLGARFELAKAIPEEFMIEAAALAGAGDTDRAKKLSKHGIASAARPRLESMVALAHSDPRIAVLSEDLDGDPYLFNCANGTIDLRTGKLRHHRHLDRLTKISPVSYDENATAPTWLRFMTDILPAEELRTFLKRWFGWVMTGIVNEEILPIFYGIGANGKSTLVNILLEILGDYGQQAPQDLLMAKRREHPTELADLFGRRLVASAEIEEGVRLNESLVKQLTGRERVRARYMRQDFFEFDPTHKLVLLTNHKPIIRGSDKGIWRRLKVVPFEVTIPESKQDKHLTEKLRAELPGILRWGIEGCLEWQRDGLPEPESVRAATADYREEQDVLGAFLDECSEIIEDDAVYTLFKTLFGTYQKWCEQNGERAMKRNDFIERLKERGFPPDHGPKNVSIRRRIRLRDDAPRPDGGGGDRLFNSSGSKHANAASSTNDVNPKGKKVNVINRENTCKTQETEERVNEGYRGSDMNADSNTSRGDHTENPLTPVNPLTHEGDAVQKTPVSFDAKPGESTTVAELQGRRDRNDEPDDRRRLSVGDVIKEFGIGPNTGPSKALAHYQESPEDPERLAQLTRAVLFARKIDTESWRTYSNVVHKAAALFHWKGDTPCEVMCDPAELEREAE